MVNDHIQMGQHMLDIIYVIRLSPTNKKKVDSFETTPSTCDNDCEWFGCEGILVLYLLK